MVLRQTSFRRPVRSSSRSRLRLEWGFVVLAVALGCSDRDKPGRHIPPPPGGQAGSGGSFNPGGPKTVDPKTCEEAAEIRAYVGCDFWPTVTANAVWPTFDFAVTIANTGEETVDATVYRGDAEVQTAQVAPGTLATLYLPWVTELKGPPADSCGSVSPVQHSTRLEDGAYHLVTSFPVSVYQFNALEYAGQGGPVGKDWSSCAGLGICPDSGQPIGCFSFSNDASLLLPSTALTPNYRITGLPGWSSADIGAFVAVTGTADGTTVTVELADEAAVSAGAGVDAIAAGQSADLSLGAGEVLQLLAPPGSDLSGSLVRADKPVQVIAGVPCIQVPFADPACDHIEETVVPAETLGKRYFVTQPTAPDGLTDGHVVRIYGNVDGTTLSYAGLVPTFAPESIDAGEVVDLGVVPYDFEIEGDQAFAVGTFMLGGSVVDAAGRGDPSQSLATALEQYRTKYVFLAPHDYDVSYVDIVQPVDAQVALDGSLIGQAVGIISSGYGVVRVELGPGQDGAHLITSDVAVGIQVVGYGDYTSYQYPGGMDLAEIAPPPVK